MTAIAVPLYLKLVLTGGLTTWLTLGVFNNLNDRKTNIELIGRMMRMGVNKDDPILGSGLQWRAVTNPGVHKRAFYFTVLIQTIGVALLWRGVVMLLMAMFGSSPELMIPQAIAAVNIGLVVLTFLWLWFLIGGLWFGYWLRLPHVQQVHMGTLMLTMLAMLVVNA